MGLAALKADLTGGSTDLVERQDQALFLLLTSPAPKSAKNGPIAMIT